jgi:CGNR zinc finger
VHNGQSASDRQALARVCRGFPLGVGVDDHGQLTLHPRTARGDRGSLSGVLVEAVTASATGRWARLKMRGAPDCRWIYYDASKARTARWCETDICGNRIKKSTQRARQRAESTRGLSGAKPSWRCFRTGWTCYPVLLDCGFGSARPSAYGTRTWGSPNGPSPSPPRPNDNRTGDSGADACPWPGAQASRNT